MNQKKLGGTLRGLFRFKASTPSKYREGNRNEYPTIALNDPIANEQKSFPENSYYTTKYTLLTFIPKILFEQFRKATSFYFLLVCIITFIKDITPIKPLPSIGGLVFILTVSAIREAFEDYMRLKADHKLNTTIYRVIEPRTGEFKEIYSYEINVGDLVYLQSGERVPLDIICLSSSNKDHCFMETSALDGETNLKLVQCPDITSTMYKDQLAQMSGTLECERPNHKLYNFKGVLNIFDNNQSISLDEKNLLLMGSVIKNTDWVIGIGVYAGPETKMSLNQNKPPSKIGTLDYKLNKYVFALFTLNVTLCIIMASLNTWWSSTETAKRQHLSSNRSGIVNFFTTFLTFFALINYIVPLSMVVTLDVTRFIQALFMKWDINMVHGDKSCDAKTSNLNDELALIEHIFTDKTGTLTENLMKFKRCSINGSVYTKSEISLNNFDEETKFKMIDFFTAMSLCHSSQVIQDGDELTYQSVSPDDEALCYGAKDVGYTYLGKEGKYLKLLVKSTGEVLKYKLLLSIDFSSERRRMSIVIKTPQKDIIMYTKGADSVIKERLANNDTNNEQMEYADKSLKKFSEKGLRTLIYARKKLDKEYWKDFQKRYSIASRSIDNRVEETSALYDELEKDLDIIGVSAVEDKLQDGVPKTIEALLSAQIKVWMITGDKQETAINIGYSTGLITSDMEVVIVNASDEKILRGLLENLKSTYCNRYTDRKFSIVIDGQTISLVLTSFREDFIEITKNASSLVCNRVTPLQKAEIVRLIKDGEDKITLAIGDGGNDVSMIQQAHVGVGVQGREGDQASRAADFSIAQFSDLQRLLLVHGRYSILRNTKVIYYSFYKNIATFLPQIWFALINGFSGQTLYNEWTMMFFNVFITSIPVFILGIFEQDLPQKLVLKYPQLYQEHKKLKFFSLVKWVGYAIYHSLVCFFFVFINFSLSGEILHNHGRTSSMENLGFYVITHCIIVITLKLIIETTHWIIFNYLAIGGSLLIYILAGLLVSLLPNHIPSQLHVFHDTLSSPYIYLSLLVVSFICILPDFIFKYMKRSFFPKIWYFFQEKEKFHSKERNRYDPVNEPLLEEDISCDSF